MLIVIDNEQSLLHVIISRNCLILKHYHNTSMMKKFFEYKRFINLQFSNFIISILLLDIELVIGN